MNQPIKEEQQMTDEERGQEIEGGTTILIFGHKWVVKRERQHKLGNLCGEKESFYLVVGSDTEPKCRFCYTKWRRLHTKRVREVLLPMAHYPLVGIPRIGEVKGTGEGR